MQNTNETILRQPTKVLSDFYYKYCSIKSTGLIGCTGFLLRVLFLSVPKVLTAKSTVSIKSTGFEFMEVLILCAIFLSRVLVLSLPKVLTAKSTGF